MSTLSQVFFFLTANFLGMLTTTAVIASENQETAGTEQEQLGEIQILAEEKEPPTVKLLLRSSILSSSNLTSIEDFDEDNIDPDLLGDFERTDVSFANGLFVTATPALDTNTDLMAYGGGNLVRYGDNDSLEYNSLNLGLGIRQQFNSQVWGTLRWRHDRVYDTGNGDQIRSPNDSDAFLVDNVLEVAVKRRDRLSEQLTFQSGYSLEGHIVNPDELTHLSNEIDLALSYQLSPQWESKLSYGLTLDSFTTVNRTDFQQQLTGAVIYRPTNQLFIEGQVAYRVGNSSLDGIDPDAFRAGIRVGYDLGLF